MKTAYLALAALTAFAALPLHAHAQTLDGVGITLGATTQLTGGGPAFNRTVTGPNTIATYSASRPDGGGGRVGVYARWKLGERGWFVQPEVALSRLSTFRYEHTFTETTDFGSFGSAVSSSIQQSRIDAALLAGYRVGKLHLLAGPVVGYGLHRGSKGGSSTGSAREQAFVNSLLASPERVQALGQVGVGLTLGRFDLTARYERSLSPAIREIRFDNQTSRYRRGYEQVMLTAGFRVYQAGR